MLVQCSIKESALKGLTESPLRALQGNEEIDPLPRMKSIYFRKTIDPADNAALQSLVDELRAQIDLIMFNSSWVDLDPSARAYFYDFDVFPVFNYANGQRDYNDFRVNDALFNPANTWATSGITLYDSQESINPESGPVKIIVWTTWALYRNNPFPINVYRRVGNNFFEQHTSSASILYDRSQAGDVGIQLFRPPDLFEYSTQTVIPPPDNFDPQPGSVMKMPIPNNIGVLPINYLSPDPPHYNWIGEFFVTNHSNRGSGQL